MVLIVLCIHATVNGWHSFGQTCYYGASLVGDSDGKIQGRGRIKNSSSSLGECNLIEYPYPYVVGEVSSLTQGGGEY